MREKTTGWTAQQLIWNRCFGAASAQNRLDVVIRDTINDGKVPGPRYLANGKEIVRPQDAVGQNGLATVAEGPEEMSAAVNRHIDFGVDQVKLTMSGEEICEPESSEKCYYTDEETAACVRVAHGRGKRLCAHARYVNLTTWDPWSTFQNTPCLVTHGFDINRKLIGLETA